MILTDASLKKMLDIISHAGNANKTTAHPKRGAEIMKRGRTKSWQRCGHIGPSHPAGGKVERFKLFGKHFGSFLSNKHTLIICDSSSTPRRSLKRTVRWLPADCGVWGGPTGLQGAKRGDRRN